MSTPCRCAFLGLAAVAGLLHAESSDYPLALNLPTVDRMQFWDIGVAFAHRFDEPAPGHGKDLYGLDGYAYPGFGFDFGIKPVKGLNAIIYRTADNKTLTFGFQQRVLDGSTVRLAVRAERFDEVVPRTVTALGTVGIAGTSLQVPTEVFLGDLGVFTLVPTYLSRTTTREQGLLTAGAGLRVYLTADLDVMAEYYPRPPKLGGTFRPGYAAGVTYRTLKHTFTLMATNALGTTANQVLSGDFAGGPRSTGQWSLGFNLLRTF